MKNRSTMGEYGAGSRMATEFDGETVLCRVCGDKASGFHYGVHACEGCKGFFRRSIQQKIQYRPCLKNQQCNIMRVNRNRCQYCRLKKCISVGMSRDAVRFGRVPKKEKARIIEQMQKVNSQTQAIQLTSSLQNPQELVQAVLLAHRQTWEFSVDIVRQMRESAIHSNAFVDCPAHMACPLNTNVGTDSNDNQIGWQNFSENFTPMIKSVVDFAKYIPGFTFLNQDDQVTLLKAATFEVLLVRLACLFDPDTNTMMFTCGKLFKRQSLTVSNTVGFLLDSMFDFAERFNKLNLSDDELALFSAVVLLSPDRPGLRNVEQVEMVQNKLTESLQNMINANHKEDETLFAKLLMKTTDLRTLNTLHSEKSIGENANAVAVKQEKSVKNTAETMMDFQNDIRSECSSPSETSSIATAASGSLMDTMSIDSGVAVMPQRFLPDSAAHQQLVLRTPYGTFYREDMAGFYGMIPDQPRRRCNTLDRDTLSRPRLHTIEEGSRRRYTMDKDYLSKMVNKLSDRLEKRAAIRGDSMPPSISGSAASSPIPEEHLAYLNSNREFIPINTPDSSACSSRASPTFLNRESLLPFGSSPSSPCPRSRSGSMGADDFRPRCYSFHMNSEGRASRVSHTPLHAKVASTSPENQHYRMAAEMRRGSVGASYGLHAKKKSLLVDRHPAYLSRRPDAIFHKAVERSPGEMEPEKKIGSGVSAFERIPRMSIGRPEQHGGWVETGQSVSGDHTIPPFKSNGMEAWRGTNAAVEPPIFSVIGQREHEQSSRTDGVPPMDDTKLNQQSESGELQNGDNSPPVTGEVFHKKFDKLRKHMVPEDDSNSSNSSGAPENEICPVNEVENIQKEKEAGKADKSKKSAVEAHPQLFAQLQSSHKPPIAAFQLQQSMVPVSAASTSSHSFTFKDQILNVPQRPFVSNGSTQATAAGNFADQQVLIQNSVPVNNGAEYALGAPNMALNSVPVNNGAEYALGTPNMAQNSVPVNNGAEYALGTPNDKDKVHAAAVLHLKDKILRKFDSMENLQKIGQVPDNRSNISHTPDTNMTQEVQNGLVQSDSYTPVMTFPGQVLPNSGGRCTTSAQSGTMVGMPIYPSSVTIYPTYYAGGYNSGQAVNLVPQYNQHLAGMQQLAQFYSPARALAQGHIQNRSEQDGGPGQPLNLTRLQGNNPSVTYSNYKPHVKEEVPS